MLFPQIKTDLVVQINDMFRISAAKSFATAGEEVTEVNIYPDSVGQPLVVFDVYEVDQDCWLLDWAYETAGEYVIKLEIKTALDTKEITHNITAMTEEEDNLLSNDQEIESYENELKRYIPEGRNSWKYIHRKAQEEILDYLYRNGKLNPDYTAITKDQLKPESRLMKWATFEAMLLIYQDLKTSNAEAFNEKLSDYSIKRNEARKRYLIKYDEDRDGQITDEDQPTYSRPTFFRR